MKTFAIFGTGNVAQTLAADMKLAGHTVRLCVPEIHADRIENLFKKPQLAAEIFIFMSIREFERFHFMNNNGHTALSGLPSSFATGQPAADNM